jgi:hypothetical protein
MAANRTLTSKQPGTPEQRAILAVVQHLKSHHQALDNIQRRETETAKRLETLSQLQAETRLLKMDLNNYVTDDEFAAMNDRVSALEQVAETPKQREQRQSEQRLTVLWGCCCIGAIALLIVGFLFSLTGRVTLLEQGLRPSPLQTYPGRP